MGAPSDRSTQEQSVLSALRLASQALEPIVEVSEASWPHGPNWQENYNRVDDENREELKLLGAKNRKIRAQNKARGLSR